MSIMDNLVLIVIVVTTILFICGIMVSLIQSQSQVKPKRKRKPEFDTEQEMLDRIDRLKAELESAQRDLYEYYHNKLLYEALPHVFIPTTDDMIRIERDNKLLAYIREYKKDAQS